LLLFRGAPLLGSPVPGVQATPAGTGPQRLPGSATRKNNGEDRSDVSVHPGRSCLTGAIAVLALLGAQAAFAGASCSVSAAGVSFGSYDISLATPTDAAGNVTVTCSYVPPGGATNVNFQASLSTGGSGSYSPRQMASGPARLNYNLFLDAARTSIWGDGLSGTSIATGLLRVGPGAGNGTRSTQLPMYGRVPAQQAVPMGAYSDTIVVTLTF
jgi:spore coat protein U-like protein